MSNKGYNFESEIEDFFLNFTNQTKKDPILTTDTNGIIRVNRSFRVPGSGAMDSLAGDIITYIPWLPKQFKVECKTRYTQTKKDGQIVVVKKEWLKKNEEEAKNDNQISALCFSFKRAQKNRIWWIIKLDDLHIYVKNIPLLVPRTVKLQESKKHDKIKFVYTNLVGSAEKNVTIFAYRYFDNFLKQQYILLSHDAWKHILARLEK